MRARIPPSKFLGYLCIDCSAWAFLVGRFFFSDDRASSKLLGRALAGNSVL